MAPDLNTAQSRAATDRLILGKRIRHFRGKVGLTLEQLGGRVGVVASQLSLVENGRREPKLSLLHGIARELDVDLGTLLSGEAPDQRSALEIELERAQSSLQYTQLGLPLIRSPKTLGDEALEAVVGLHRELGRRSRAAAATPEEARRANTAIRHKMREKNNYLPDIEREAEGLMARAGHTGGAVTHRTVAVLAEILGFTLIFVDDLPSNTRSITDLENGRIYLPPTSIPGGHGLRSLALQAMGHRVLGHDRPASYGEFLEQRLQINYFASACLLPEQPAAEFLQQAKASRNLAIEDFRDAFGVTHEAAAHRFTNLATQHLDLRVHFMRAAADGALTRGYENDGMPLPEDSSGSIEGQILCRKWPARTAFERTNRTSEFYQYTDTPVGTYWESVQSGDPGVTGSYSTSCGVAFNDAKWFRGRDTSIRTVSTCPDESCCRTPSTELLHRWQDHAWPSARMHAHVLSPLPTGSFPGVDDTIMYEFLSRHAPGES
jgi:transcriptional regulator with XRE-family HTH domain